MGCVVKSCRKVYHYPCATTSGGEMIEDVGFYCVDHLQDAYAGIAPNTNATCCVTNIYIYMALPSPPLINVCVDICVGVERRVGP